MRIIVVAGPAGGGKTTQANLLAMEFGCPIVRTDDYLNLPWEQVPREVGRVLRALAAPVVILEGVRALAVIEENGLAKFVDAVWWCDKGPGKPHCEAILSGQENLMDRLGFWKNTVRPMRRR